MGLPQILIDFKTKADSVIQRSERGIVALILKDNTSTFDNKVYTKEADIVASHWTTSNKDYISKAFMGNPSRVIVERIATTATDYTVALARLKNKAFNYLTIPAIATADVATIKDWIKTQRDTNKKTFKAVLPNIVADYEGVINFCTESIKVGTKTYTASEYTARIAGILAGLPLSQSSTYFVLSEVETITESQTPDADIDAGKLILINDGSKIKIGRGVNSLTTLTDTKGDSFKKIKIVEAIDLIRDDIRSTFENNYVGKIANSYDNKILFIAAVNRYFNDLESQGVLYDKFDNKADIDIAAQTEWLKLTMVIDDWSETQIKQAATGSNLFVTAQVKIQDAIEDLKFSIYM